MPQSPTRSRRPPPTAIRARGLQWTDPSTRASASRQRQSARLVPHRDAHHRCRRLLSDHAFDRRGRDCTSRPTPRASSTSSAATRSPSRPKANTRRRAAPSRTRSCGKRVVNFTSGQGIVYGVEQYYHAPGKLSTMVLEVGARALTKHALNVHCGHDDVYAALDTGWIMLFGKDAQQAADQALILRQVTELAPHARHERAGRLPHHAPRAHVLQARVGADPRVSSARPTTSSTARPRPARAVRHRSAAACRKMIDLKNPVLLGPVQNQEHYMKGVVARREQLRRADPRLPRAGLRRSSAS